MGIQGVTGGYQVLITMYFLEDWKYVWNLGINYSDFSYLSCNLLCSEIIISSEYFFQEEVHRIKMRHLQHQNEAFAASKPDHESIQNLFGAILKRNQQLLCILH